MKIVKPKDEMDQRMNYLVVHNRNKKVFIFRDYKTAGKYSEVKIPVSKELNTDRFFIGPMCEINRAE